VRHRKEWTRCFDGRVSHDDFDRRTGEGASGNAIRISMPQYKNRTKANLYLTKFRAEGKQSDSWRRSIKPKVEPALAAVHERIGPSDRPKFCVSLHVLPLLNVVSLLE
jgi:hypothetical protein